jgi:hypothetical protein
MAATSFRHLSQLWRRRSDRVHWLSVALLAVVSALLVWSADRRAGTAAAAWGDTVVVVRATASIEPGAPVDSSAVAEVAVPRTLVPDTALARLPEQARASRRVAGGAILTRLDIASPTGPRSGARALLIDVHPDHPLPEAGVRLELVVGTAVDPYAAAVPITELVPATLLEARPGSWLVEIEQGHASAVAVATITGTVIPLIAGP